MSKKFTDVQLANRIVSLLNGQTTASAINVLSSIYVSVALDAKNVPLLQLSLMVLRKAVTVLEARLAELSDPTAKPLESGSTAALVEKGNTTKALRSEVKAPVVTDLALGK